LQWNRSIGLRLESTLRAFRPVSASLTDFLPVQDLRQILEQELDTLGHRHAQGPGDPAKSAG